MFFTTLTSVLALASFASAAAPSVLYPHQGTVWENTWFHNVTWAPQSGTGSIMLTHGGTMTTLINNVDLSTGRVVIQVPKSVMQASDWIVQIAAGGDTSSSNAFAIGPPSAVAPGGGSSASGSGSAMSSAMSSATGSMASASSISASAGSSAAASAASSMSSMMSMSMSGSSVVESASSSVSSEINSASASAQSQFSSLLSSASSAGAASMTSAVSSASESGASKLSSVASSATAPAGSSGSSSGAAPLGFSMFGATIAAGLVAITTLSGALVL